MTLQQILVAVILLLLVGRLGNRLKIAESRRNGPDPRSQA